MSFAAFAAIDQTNHFYYIICELQNVSLDEICQQKCLAEQQKYEIISN